MRTLILDLIDLIKDFIWWYRNDRFEYEFVVCLNQLNELLWYEKRIEVEY